MSREKNSIELLAAMAADAAMHCSMAPLLRARKSLNWMIEFALERMGDLDALRAENARLKSDLVAAAGSYRGVLQTMEESREKADARVAELEADRAKAWTHYADCANTPLMSDVIAERDRYREALERIADSSPSSVPLAIARAALNHPEIPKSSK